MTTFLWGLCENAIATAILAAVLGALGWPLRRRPGVQHALWLIVLIKFVTPPVVVWPWSVQDFARPWLPATASRLERAAEQSHSSAASADALAVLPAALTATELSHRESLSPRDTSAIRASGPVGASTVHPRFSLAVAAQGLFWGWCLGSVAAVLIQLRRVRQVRLLIRRGTPAPRHLTDEIERLSHVLRLRPVRTVLVGSLASPFVWCLGRLRLVWPEALSSECEVRRARGVIAHELAHIQRRDHWVAWLELAAGLVWWWNPVFWFVRHRLRLAAELACDALALAALPAERRAYAELLLELSSSFKSGTPAPVLGVSTGAPCSFERRLSMILSEGVTGKVSALGVLLAGLLALVALPGWSLGQGTVERSTRKRPQLIGGVVSEIDRELGRVTISIGSKHGLPEGGTLDLYRHQPNPGPLGKIEILEIETDHAVVSPTAAMIGQYRQGDAVSVTVLVDKPYHPSESILAQTDQRTSPRQDDRTRQRSWEAAASERVNKTFLRRLLAEASVEESLESRVQKLEQKLDQVLGELRKGQSSTGPRQPSSIPRFGTANRALAGSSLDQLHQALHSRQTTLGGDHPDTLRARNDLAEAYRAAGQTDKAVGLHEQALALRQSTLGADHPQTIQSMANLAQSYRAAGREEEARALEQRVTERSMKKSPKGARDSAAKPDSSLHEPQKADPDNARQPQQPGRRGLRGGSRGAGTSQPAMDLLRSSSIVASLDTGDRSRAVFAIRKPDRGYRVLAIDLASEKLLWTTDLSLTSIGQLGPEESVHWKLARSPDSKIIQAEIAGSEGSVVFDLDGATGDLLEKAVGARLGSSAEAKPAQLSPAQIESVAATLREQGREGEASALAGKATLFAEEQAASQGVSAGPIDLAKLGAECIDARAAVRLAETRHERLKRAGAAISQEEVETAEINLDTARQKLELLTSVAKVTLETAQAELDAAREKAAFTRKLVAKGFVSMSEADQAVAQVAGAEAKLRLVESILSPSASGGPR